MTSWNDRLTAISVIVCVVRHISSLGRPVSPNGQTTFFAAIEASLLQITTPAPNQIVASTRTAKAADVTLSTALVVHIFAGEHPDVPFSPARLSERIDQP